MPESPSIISAAIAGDASLVLELLDAGTPIESTGEHGETALHGAVAGGHVDIVRLLLQRGADPDAIASDGHDSTPLRIAIMFGRDESVDALLEGGATVDLADSEGNTAIFGAAALGHATIVESLVDRGAEVNRRNEDGVTPLMLAVIHAIDEDEERRERQFGTVLNLLTRGADPNLRDPDGSTALHVACAAAHQQMVSFLIVHGADADMATDGGLTPLGVALAMGRRGWGVVAQLMDAGVQPNTAEQAAAVERAFEQMTAAMTGEAHGSAESSSPSPAQGPAKGTASSGCTLALVPLAMSLIGLVALLLR